MFFGLSAIGYEAGILGYVIGVGYAIGLLILGYFVPRIKKAMSLENCDTMDDFLGSRYGHVAQIATVIINLSFFLAVLAAQFLAMTAFLGIFITLDSDLLFYAAVAVVLMYTALAGFKGVLFTDVWQFWIVGFCVLVIFVVLTINANWTNLGTLESHYFNATGYGTGFLVGVLLFFPLTLLVRTDLWQRIASANAEQTAQRAFYACAPILLVFYVLMTTIGLYARASLGPGVSADISGLTLFLETVGYTRTSASFLPNLFVAILALGVFAALLSTIDTNLNVISVALSKAIRRNEWARFERETPDKISGSRTDLENGLLTTARIVTLVVGILGLIVAWLIPDIVNLLVGAASMLLVFMPAVLATLFLGSRYAAAASLSIVAGYVTFLIFFFLGEPKTAFLPGVGASILCYFTIRFLYPHQSRFE